MNKKKIIAASVAGGVCAVTLLVVGICAPATSAFDNAGKFFQDLSLTLTPTGGGGSGSVAVTKEKLAAPTEFAIDEEGNYSFKGVDNAGYYVLQFFDRKDAAGENYLFMSTPIPVEDDNTYSGRCEDLFHYAYLNYTAKLFAYPAYDDTKHDISDAVSCDYSFSGAISKPNIAYFYNANTKTIDIEIENLKRDYYYEAYPDTVVVTLTDTADTSKKQTVEFKDISADTKMTTVKVDHEGTYKIEAYATSTNEAVTNHTTETAVVAESIALTNKNKLSDNYYHSADNLVASDPAIAGLYGGWGWWPLLCDSFDIANGGFAGRMHGRVGAGHVSQADATPLAAAPTLSAEAAKMTADAQEKLGYTGKTVAHYYSMRVNFNNANLIADGHLYLYEDGSMLYMVMYATVGPCKPGYLFGSWVDNGDGTATLNYSPNPDFKA